jgi:FkbM family methyltransferase
MANGNYDPILLPLASGQVLAVPPQIDRITAYVVMEQEGWFEIEYPFVGALVRPGDQVLDIGANYGLYTLRLAQAVGPSGHVRAFEPASDTARYLRNSISANKLTNVQVIQAALADASGHAELALHDNSELNSLVETSGATHTETVNVHTLDELLLEQRWERLDFIKLDAEGMERPILHGAHKTLDRFDPAFMYEVKHGSETNLDLIGTFQSLGYQSYRLVPGLQLLSPVATSDKLDAYCLNLFAYRPTRIKQFDSSNMFAESASGSIHISLSPEHRWRKRIHEFAYWDTSSSISTTKPQPEESFDCYFYAHDTSLNPTSRLQALVHAAVSLGNTLNESSSFWQLATYARLAGELGWRNAEVQALQQIANRLAAGAKLDPLTPFLPCCPRFDGIDPEGRLRDWLFASALEQLEQQRVYSSFYSPLDSRKILDTYMRLGFTCEAMERRARVLQKLMEAHPRS